MAYKPTGNKVGRPKIELTPEQWDIAHKLANIHCTKEEIASLTGISEDTLDRLIRERYDKTFSEWFTVASAGGKVSIRRLQFKKAMDGNVTMLIWLGKQWLGQRDKVENASGPSNGLLPEILGFMKSKVIGD